jgi:hypothetical protein
MYDELAQMISNNSINKKVESWVYNNLAFNFQELFLAEDSDPSSFFDDQESSADALDPDIWMNLDGDVRYASHGLVMSQKRPVISVTLGFPNCRSTVPAVPDNRCSAKGSIEEHCPDTVHVFSV